MAQANFFPEACQSGGGSGEFLAGGFGFLGKLGKILDGDGFSHAPVLVQKLQFSEELGPIEVEESLGLRGPELNAIERANEFSGTATVFRDDFIESRGCRGSIDGTERLRVVIEGIQKAGDVFCLVFKELGQVFRGKFGKIAGDQEPG